MKRKIAALLLVVSLIVLAGCSSSKTTGQSENKPAQTGQNSGSSNNSSMQMDADPAKLAAEGAGAMAGVLKTYSKNVSFHKDLKWFHRSGFHPAFLREHHTRFVSPLNPV